MTVRYNEERLEWAKKMLEWDAIDWTTVILKDEKKLNLNGPDDFCHYWHYLRQERENFSKKKQGGASVMVWGAIYLKEKL